MNKLAIVCAVAAIPLVGATLEEPLVRSSEDVQIVFASLDRNHDQKISRNEATLKQSVSKRFEGIDSDGNGYLSKAEFAARPSAERFE
jgi:Ca2+-binding EF-hand superfamily protein